MKKLLTTSLILALAVTFSGCLVTGQIVIVEAIDIGVTTDENISRYLLDLNENDDYLDNKEKILSVDALALVAPV